MVVGQFPSACVFSHKENGPTMVSFAYTVMFNRRFLHTEQSIRIFSFIVVYIFNRRYQTGNFNLKFHFLVETLLDRQLRFALIASSILLWGRQLRC